MIKVVHIQYSTNSAGSAAFRLHKELLKAGIDSSIVSLIADIPGYHKIKYLGRLPKLTARVNNKLQSYLIKNIKAQYGFFTYPIAGTNVAKLTEVRDADIIYVHWALNGFLNFRSLHQLARLQKPIVFFMHDMWTITGGCHYSFSCEKYKTACQQCQMFEGVKMIDLSAKQFKRKSSLYSSYDNLFFISPSKWLYSCSKEAMLIKNKPLFHIPNILDNTLFKPINKQEAKKVFNIGSNEAVVAFGAVSVNNPYKGWAYLQKALAVLKLNNDIKKDISVLIFGSGYNQQIADAIPFKTYFLGFLKDEYSLALAYNAADVFVAPSLADNLPTTILESLSCGTAVVGFDVGGIPDMIRHKKNGYLAKYKDAVDIAKGITYCINENTKGDISPEFKTALVIKKHLELFDYIRSSDPKKI
ncbi:glycosyltransferase [Ilyomonas limi]|uniref:Glycosyltransferase n=1 Tax=Ilyomonas limi TaxID=2575867 RepID=A0A4U3L5Q2_9BACT|nr:glycosyltransferase [Ilyomonas limi]TKK70330.1 glycosyltransferase [Ilyomonas limi]